MFIELIERWASSVWEDALGPQWATAYTDHTMPKGYISVKQAAERLGLSEQAVRNLCQRGRITAERISDVWLIDEEALKNFKPQKRGKRITKE